MNCHSAILASVKYHDFENHIFIVEYQRITGVTTSIKKTYFFMNFTVLFLLKLGCLLIKCIFFYENHISIAKYQLPRMHHCNNIPN